MRASFVQLAGGVLVVLATAGLLVLPAKLLRPDNVSIAPVTLLNPARTTSVEAAPPLPLAAPVRSRPRIARPRGARSSDTSTPAFAENSSAHLASVVVSATPAVQTAPAASRTVSPRATRDVRAAAARLRARIEAARRRKPVAPEAPPAPPPSAPAPTAPAPPAPPAGPAATTPAVVTPTPVAPAAPAPTVVAVPAVRISNDTIATSPEDGHGHGHGHRHDGDSCPTGDSSSGADASSSHGNGSDRGNHGGNGPKHKD